MKRFLPWIAAPLVVGTLIVLIWQERKRPLRRRVEPGLKHGIRNAAIAGIGALAMIACEAPLILPLARTVEQRRWGVLGLAQLPGWAEAVLALLLMDYTFYVWHILLHRTPFLWRFHAVHHVDLDLDTSTALRFHFGEIIASIPWRAAQVLVIGLNPIAFLLWQTWFALCVMFHHSNVRLPIQWERCINRLLVTPRMHGIHHSNVQEETDSNWSSGLTVWDRLHGTLRLNVPQAELKIGVPAFTDLKSVGLLEILALPFGEQPTYWLPDGATPPAASISADRPFDRRFLAP